MRRKNAVDKLEKACSHRSEDWGLCTLCDEVTEECKILGNWKVNGVNVNGNYKKVSNVSITINEDKTYTLKLEDNSYTGKWVSWEAEDKVIGYTLVQNEI